MCRLHLLNKHLNGPASLEDAFKESFILCPFLFPFLFCLHTEPFYHLQHKKLDKTRNFSAGSRAVRFVCREMCVCARRVASLPWRLPARVCCRVESAEGPSVGALTPLPLNLFIEHVLKRPSNVRTRPYILPALLKARLSSFDGIRNRKLHFLLLSLFCMMNNLQQGCIAEPELYRS